MSTTYRLLRETNPHDSPNAWREIARGNAAAINQAWADDVHSRAGYGCGHKVIDETGDDAFERFLAESTEPCRST